MAVDISRRTFVAGSAALGAAYALGGPISAYADSAPRTRNSARRPPATGRSSPRPRKTRAQVYLALPAGFKYRLINRSGAPMRNGLPTPGIFDGMAAYDGPGGRTVLIRNHENRSRPGEITVPVPTGKRYDPTSTCAAATPSSSSAATGGCEAVFPVLGGTHTNCAGGQTPVGHVDHLRGDLQLRLGRVQRHARHRRPARLLRSRSPLTPTARSRRSRSSTPAASRTRPSRGWTARCMRPRTAATRASTASSPSGARRRPAISRPSAARCRRWSCAGARTSTPTPPARRDATRSNGSPIEEPNPLTDTVRAQAQAKGAAIFDRTEGIWTAGDRVYFDCTTGGDAGLGQLWELRPRGSDGGDLKLIYESVAAEDLENPDNLVVVPAHRRRLPAGGLRRRAVRPRRHPAWADLRLRPHRAQQHRVLRRLLLARRPDLLRQPAGRPADGDRDADLMPDARAGLTFAIWGGFDDRKTTKRTSAGARGARTARARRWAAVL